MTEEIPQSFNELYYLLLDKLKEERRKREAVESEVVALKKQAIADRKFLLEQFQETMATHTKLFEEKVQAMKDEMKLTADILYGADYIDSGLIYRVKQLERPGKTNNNMKG